jgi:hypothetical protein
MTYAVRRPRGARSALLALVAGTVLATGLVATPGSTPAVAPPAPAKSRILLGVAGDVDEARKRTGQKLAAHHYGYFERKVPTGKMISVRFQKKTMWRSTAALKSGTAAHRDVVRWADTLKKRNKWTYVAFHHEPESSGSNSYGSAADYKAAFRKIVTTFRARGARKVIFTWQMTDWAFRAKPSAHNAAAKWYPGNAYVDVVGADPYNWHNCGHGLGRWNSMKTLVDPVIRFARPRGKQVVLPEFASVRHAKRPEWLRETGRYLAKNDDVIAAAFYFHRRPTNRANSDCTWPLSSAQDFAALASVAKGKRFRA